MKYKNIWLFIFVCLFLFNFNNVKADEYVCDEEQYAIYQKLAEQITVTYQRQDGYYNEDGSVNYDFFLLEVNGLNERLALFNYEIPLGISGLLAVDGNYVTYGIKSGTYTFYVKAFSAYCKNEIFRTITVTIPKFNAYSEREECEGIDPQKFALCSPYYQNKIEEETFLIRVEQYKKENKKDLVDVSNDDLDDTSSSVKKNNWFSNVIKFIINYYLYFIIGLVLIIIAVIIIVLKKKGKFKKRLVKKKNFKIEV